MVLEPMEGRIVSVHHKLPCVKIIGMIDKMTNPHSWRLDFIIPEINVVAFGEYFNQLN